MKQQKRHIILLLKDKIRSGADNHEAFASLFAREKVNDDNHDHHQHQNETEKPSKLNKIN